MNTWCLRFDPIARAMRRARCAVRDAPCAMRRARCAVRDAPCAVRDARRRRGGGTENALNAEPGVARGRARRASVTCALDTLGPRASVLDVGSHDFPET
jgi:hypothetical protein